MILTKAVPCDKHQIILHSDNFDSYTWNILSEILDFPYESVTVDLTIEGTTWQPRLFQPEECSFIPIDKKSILGKVD